MGSIVGHRIDYNGVGALRGLRHIPSKTWPKYFPPPWQWNLCWEVAQTLRFGLPVIGARKTGLITSTITQLSDRIKATTVGTLNQLINKYKVFERDPWYIKQRYIKFMIHQIQSFRVSQIHCWWSKQISHGSVLAILKSYFTGGTRFRGSRQKMPALILAAQSLYRWSGARIISETRRKRP